MRYVKPLDHPFADVAGNKDNFLFVTKTVVNVVKYSWYPLNIAANMVNAYS